MAGNTFIAELNFIKFVLDDCSKMFRSSFIRLWHKTISALPGYQSWDDALLVRNLLQKSESWKAAIPACNSMVSINEWDSTALFIATIYVNTFALCTAKAKKTLHALYLKGKKPSPFHSSVIGASGNMEQTLALSTEQLRLLRNTLCHMPLPFIELVDFNQYLLLAKDAFTANGVSVKYIEGIECLGEEEFPSSKITRIKIQLPQCNKFLQRDVGNVMSAIAKKPGCAKELVMNGNCAY